MNKEHQSDMDALLMYRNLLAAEDHLEELDFRAEDSASQATAKGIMYDTITLRDRVMPPEVNPEYHCVVKHLAAAYEASREIWKAKKDLHSWWNKKYAYDLLCDALSELWGRRIMKCERCTNGDERNTESSGEHTSGGVEHGEPRDLIQTVSLSGGLSLHNSEETSGSWDGTSRSRGEAIQGESRGTEASDGDSTGEVDTN